MARVPLAIQPTAGNSHLSIPEAAGPKRSLNKLNALNTPGQQSGVCSMDYTAHELEIVGTITFTPHSARAETERAKALSEARQVTMSAHQG